MSDHTHSPHIIPKGRCEICDVYAEIAQLRTAIKEWTDAFGSSVEAAATRWQEVKAEVERLTRELNHIYRGRA